MNYLLNVDGDGSSVLPNKLSGYYFPQQFFLLSSQSHINYNFKVLGECKGAWVRPELMSVNGGRFEINQLLFGGDVACHSHLDARMDLFLLIQQLPKIKSKLK